MGGELNNKREKQRGRVGSSLRRGGDRGGKSVVQFSRGKENWGDGGEKSCGEKPGGHWNDGGAG